MTYKEFVLLYTTLITGLSCANIFYGVAYIIQDWKEIKINWVFFLSPAALLMTVIDFWFHAFMFPYDMVEHSIVLFIIFLLPPITLFFCTLITFPSKASQCKNYTNFFQRILRPVIFTYALMLVFTLIQITIIDFMVNIIFIPLAIILILNIVIYKVNTLKFYKIMVCGAFCLNLLRWGVEGLYY